MHNFTQMYYDDIMNYVGLNQRSAGLLATTRLTGFVRWHQRNHEVYDKMNQCITKWIGNMYEEYATPKMVETYNYMMDGKSITPHLRAWYNALEPMKIHTYEMYKEACEIGDFILADKFKHFNMVVVNELFTLGRLMKRLENATETDLMIVNRIIHDWLEENPDCDELDFSL